MKSLFISALAILIGTFAFANDDIAGKWKGIVATPDGDYEVYFNFSIDEGEITGTFDTGMSLDQIEDGKFKEDSDKVFTFNAWVEAVQAELFFKCTIKEKDKILVEIVGADMFFDISRVKEE